MSGTKAGGMKAKAKNLASNPNYYSEMGKRGGLAKVPKGFAMNRELASEAGKKGGAISRRKPAEPKATHPWRKTLVKSLLSKQHF